MFELQPKPQFHNYPLRTSQLSKLNMQMAQIDQQIYQNHKQIQQINKKFSNQQYQSAFLNRLMQKNRILSLKKEQLQQINKMHLYHKFNENQQKNIDKHMYKNLANEYKSQIQQKKRKKSEQKQLQRKRERQLLIKNFEEAEKLQNMKNKNTQNVYYSNAVTNNKIQRQLKNKDYNQRQSQKIQFIRQIERTNQSPSQKQTQFQKFYDQNKQKLHNLQKIYKVSTQPKNIERISRINQIQDKNERQFLRNLQNKYNSEIQRRNFNNKNLKNHWDLQMNQINQEVKNSQISKLNGQIKRRNRQIDNEKYQIEARQKAKKYQYLYSSELAKQFNQQVQLQKNNSRRSYQHSYLNASSDSLRKKQMNSPDSPRSGSNLGFQKNRVGMHNPLSNPIPFSIGMTNPYILKQYQNRRSQNFKGSNLAQLGDQSFRI